MAQWRRILRGGPALLVLLAVRPLAAQAGANVVLVTLDGVRPQEFFAGMDSTVAAREDDSGIEDSARVWREYWRDTPAARRRAVMPFFWDSLAPRGVVLGDEALGSPGRITNHQGFSAPGYLEILTGRAQDDVVSNDQIRYPHRTVLQFARERLDLGPAQVAAFTSWENFRWYVSSVPDEVLVNAGFDSLPAPYRTPRLDALAALQARALPVWEGSRLDAFTGAMGLEYLRWQQPRVLFLAFNDTDDFAHQRRYDRVLDALHNADAFLRELWQTLQASPAYRGRTTLLLTTDHGRGLTPRSWTDHGREVPGSERIWLAAVGPGTAARDVLANQPVTQSQVAATLLRCLGLDPAAFTREGGAPIMGVCQ